MFNNFFEITMREKLSEKLQDKAYAQAMYAALCNQGWAYPALAPKGHDWRSTIKENTERNYAKTNAWWRDYTRKFLDSIRYYVTIPLGHRNNIETDESGFRILHLTLTPFWGKLDSLVMRLRFGRILCPGWNTLDWTYGCSWRYAGGLIADLRNMCMGTNEDYMDYYCSGSLGENSVAEGTVTEEIEEDLNNLGWFLIPEEVA